MLFGIDFSGFVAAIISHWVSLMSGIASVVLTILGFVRRWDTFPRRVIWITALACFLIAAIKVWTTEHQDRIKAEAELEELTKPKLSGVIEGRVFGVAEAKNNQSIVTLNPLITNTGAPSVALDFNVQIELFDGRKPNVMVIPPPRPDQYFTLVAEHKVGSVSFLGSDFVPRKASINPIPKGGVAEGFIAVLVGAKREDIFRPETSIILVWKDVNGAPYSCGMHPKGRGQFPDFEHLQDK
jgi:hypothetical protein